ncbi:MAG TPA: glycosyltransferase [Thermoanaerobaculia bacterium]|jgi:hypothetical protein|nr:glycosyltransferase [Thermoanaerobaculia bacterium]
MTRLVVAPFAALRGYVSREFFRTLWALVANHGWRFCETSSFRGAEADAVLFWESYDVAAHHMRALQAQGTRVYVMTDDLHKARPGMHDALRLADGILSTYAPRFGAFFPDIDPSRVRWTPHAASSDFVLPLAKNPYRQVFVSGAMTSAYPLRLLMRDLALRRPEIARLQDHPGYHTSYRFSHDGRIGRGYAQSIRACLAAFTDALQYGYIVAKHFEIPATGALLLADRAVAPQLSELGFVDGQHYVSMTADELEATVERVLDPRNAAEILAIRRAGHELVYARHTTANRAREIDALIEDEPLTRPSATLSPLTRGEGD